MAWEENSRICLHMQLIAILSRIGVIVKDKLLRAVSGGDTRYINLKSLTLQAR